ncbi:hypothetical protein YYG_00738 [Plasmodium vinckei petteri]|uniref:Trafficking protein particle complex subunit n=1 Tax=Plasmodium vinckei petteri TaxID=138298 RepID=W7AP49_PLAVN|nr:hypothetical protein YYG_00738 [Plasmodium vinckei petteri]CAD2107531.1 trafficking protein particle complex subunit 1, putative [Plasmodium vinckei petteri]
MLHEKSADVSENSRDYYFYIFYKNQPIFNTCLKNNDQEKNKIDSKKLGRENKESKNETEKLLLGSIYAINYLCFNIQPNKKLKNLYKLMDNGAKNINVNTKTHEQNLLNTQNNLHVGNFNSFNTPLYKLHYFETLTAYKFVLITHKDMANLSDFLKDIYKTIFLDLIILNPLYQVGDEIRDKIFDDKIKERIRSLFVV